MDDVHAKISQYYTEKLKLHGATPRGVDWNSAQTQEIRFAQMLQLLPPDQPITLLDYGCGYGAFAPYFLERSPESTYIGYDVSTSMLKAANALHGADRRCRFIDDESALEPVDVVVASGIFSVKMTIATEDWRRYTFATILRLSDLARTAFAFNMLTTYSDPQFLRDDLYYADPLEIFEYCRTHFSRWIALRHDYGLYEFTIHVRKKLEMGGSA